MTNETADLSTEMTPDEAESRRDAFMGVLHSAERRAILNIECMRRESHQRALRWIRD